ncbi:hypothetical protein SAMN05421823_104547 [Catalinimonas alkaloidigena]|uniref:DUF2231 domain-containing protein n=1 Tax=Catalinimonas alkaloidigena TaxID=1075417 RepID=A0A1G9HUT0_9BACT|nr:hypothetical protein [Catalinimonas alkaloidigena]SDL16709.1 hypothetical protein SAMN05421823_104547 [Catalinimonas alkaloidigena]
MSYFHLVLGYLPFVGIVLGFVLLFWGQGRGHVGYTKVGLLALAFAAVAVVLAWLTGGQISQPRVHYSISPELVSHHVTAARTLLWAVWLSGGFSLLAYAAITRRHRRYERLLWTALGLSFITLLLLAQVVYWGRRLHPPGSEVDENTPTALAK